MSLYKWYGYLGTDPFASGDINAGGNDLTNVGLLIAQDVFATNLTSENIKVTGCIGGPDSMTPLVVCNDLDVVGNANAATLSVESNSTIQGDLDVQGSLKNTTGPVYVDDDLEIKNRLIMPYSPAEPPNTLNLMNVTVISGPPTSVLLDGVIPGSLVFDDTNNKLYHFDGLNWVQVGTVTNVGLIVPTEFNVIGSPVTTSGSFTIQKNNQIANLVYAGPAVGAPAQPTFRSLVSTDIPAGVGIQNWSQVLAVGNTSGAFDPTINNGQQIQFVGGLAVGSNNQPATVGAASSITIGGLSTTSSQSVSVGFGVSGLSANGTAIGYGTYISNVATSGTAIGYNASVGHANSTAIGESTSTTANKQLMLGADNTYFVETPGYFLSGRQKSAAAGITPGVSAAQSITTGSGLTTVLIKDVLYDWTPTMINTNLLLLSDQQHVFIISALVRGTFANPLTNRIYNVQLIWFDGSVQKTIGQMDMYVAANAPTFSCTLTTSMKTIAATGQYVYVALDNTTGSQMDITHFRFTATRVT